MEIRQSYVVKTDAKRRVLLRGKPYPYYRVREFSNGCLLLEPREMVAPQGITAGSSARRKLARSAQDRHRQPEPSAPKCLQSLAGQTGPEKAFLPLPAGTAQGRSASLSLLPEIFTFFPDLAYLAGRAPRRASAHSGQPPSHLQA